MQQTAGDSDRKCQNIVARWQQYFVFWASAVQGSSLRSCYSTKNEQQIWRFTRRATAYISSCSSCGGLCVAIS